MSSPPSSTAQAEHSAGLASPRRLQDLWERFKTSPSTNHQLSNLPASPPSPSDEWMTSASARERQRTSSPQPRPDHHTTSVNFPTSTLRVDGEPLLLRSKSSSVTVPTSATASAESAPTETAAGYRLNPPRFTQAQSHAHSRASSSGSSHSPRGSRLSAYSGASAASAVGALAALSGQAGMSFKGKAKASDNGTGGGYEAMEGVSGLGGVNGSDDGELSALDGDEGVLVDDEACFVEGAQGRVGK